VADALSIVRRKLLQGNEESARLEHSVSPDKGNCIILPEDFLGGCRREVGGAPIYLYVLRDRSDQIGRSAVEKKDIMSLAYDREADVLYLSIGEPRRAVSRELGDDVLLRVDPDTGAVVGLTVLNLSTRSTLENLPVQVNMREAS
jgi:uncharacterized protein YuzE